MITGALPFLASPRMTLGAFTLALYGSPVLEEAGGASAFYSIASSAGVDPCFLLAMFTKESSLGTAGVAINTHSWGNMRNPPVGNVPYHIYTDPAKGSYLSFASWKDGCTATCAHIRYYADALGITTIAQLPYKWAPTGDGANSPAAYGQFLVDWMNAHTDIAGGTMPRIIVSAGHQNIGNITADKIGQASADDLRGGTGANGEMQWNVQTASALANLLRAAGADVALTDAIYHEDVYAQDADLCVAIHYDGGGGTGHAQYCMASVVHSGPSTENVDTRAQTFVDAWYKSYPLELHIPGSGPVTNDMLEYYGGWYRTAQTPMIILEHCLGADANGIRPDRPAPELAAKGDFDAIAAVLDLKKQPPPPPIYVPPGNPHGAFPIDPILWPRWNYLNTLGLALPQIGWPLTMNAVHLPDGRTAQRFERGWLAGTNPADVVMLFPEEYPDAA